MLKYKKRLGGLIFMKLEVKQSRVSYGVVKHLMCEFNRCIGKSKEVSDLKAVIVFTEDSFATRDLPLDARSYVISNDNKAFIDGMGGYSIFGSSLDGEDRCVRLESYMKAERGGENGWKVEYCYFI